jgi:SNF2 family DNA or RNA helicase
MGNWIDHIEKYINTNKEKKRVLNTVMYHGPKRANMLLKLHQNKYDVVIVSYNTLVSEMKKEMQKKSNKNTDEDDNGADHQVDGSLGRVEKSDDDDDDEEPTIFDLVYHRLVLDEAHVIRNDTKNFRAFKMLQADHKWVSPKPKRSI